MTDKLKPAEYIVFWPGKEILACTDHMIGLQTINEVMGGLPISVRKYSGYEPCINCVNEAKESR